MDYELFRDSYEEELNAEGDVIIGAFSMAPSEILKQLDDELYNQGFREYIQRQKEDHQEVVLHSFPAPIAYFFHLVINGYDSDNHRLQLLRSAWESVIYVLYALVLADVQDKQLSISQVRVFNNEPIRPVAKVS